ncbi:MAG: hypothetical protein KTR21_13325 [Rhodobacteraceae bacterium]|nr:hypothetical protein [Paracoccaceae bacterium]
MAIEVPDLFQPRNLIAVGLAGAIEIGISMALDVDPKMSSFALMAMIFVFIAWLAEKLYRVLFLKKKVIDELSDQTEIKTQLPGDTLGKGGP